MGRTFREYVDAFSQLSDQVLSQPFETKREADHAAAQARTAVRKARDVFTFEISQTWRGGFNALKAENDQMQRDLKKAFDDEIQMISERLGDIYEAIGG